MSMFGSLLGDMDDDPFFSAHRRQMQHMEDMLGFPSLLGPHMNPLTAGPGDFNRNRQLMPYSDMGGFGGMFGGFGRMFRDMESMSADPNMHSYSSSSVMTMTTNPDGTPQVYQASSSTRQAPGGVKEIRKSELDSRSGMRKMAIGHHIGERAHVIEKEKNNVTGEEEERQEYINLDEEEAPTFNQEWCQKTEQNVGAILNHRRHGYSQHHHRPHIPAIAGPSSSSHDRRKRESRDEGLSIRGKKMGKHSKPRHETNM